MAKETHLNTTEAELKAVAKAVGASLKRAGHVVPHSTMLHAVAAALNKRDWNTLKATLEPSHNAVPAKQPARLEYEDRTWFFLRLAMAKGNPVSPVLADNSQALARAVAAAGETVEGVLSWGGWNLPATLTFKTSHIDAGDFKPEKPAAGRMRVNLKGGIKVDFEVGYTATAGWYVSSRGHQEFYEQLEQVLPEAQVISSQTETSPEAPGTARPAVKAKFWTDDHVFEVEFDATAYLATASDADLTAIMQVGFCGDDCTDAVALYFSDKGLNEELVDAFTYLGAMQKAKRRDQIGFECEVDREDYLRWMSAHRRLPLARMLCAREGVGIVEAPGAEIKGRWNWLRRETGDACGHSYETENEAILAAYEQLGLLEDALAGLI